MKKLLRNLSFCLLAGSLFAACGKKEPEPGPGYYFKFKADGVAYHYEYERKVGFVGTASNMGAFQSTSTAWGGTYQIYASKSVTGSATGEVRFFLNKDDFKSLDTIVLDGVRNSVEIYNLNASSNNYLQRGIHSGKIILSDKTTDALKGIFYFDCEQQYDKTVMSVTEGEFFVGRAN